VGGRGRGLEWVVREGVGAGGEMNQALYAHMNNKRKKNSGG
jgi:NaMN:DMB phosphoribosyltransferase